MKYLYVLASDDSDLYFEQALLSLTSLRLRMPNAFVSLLTDDLTVKNLCGKRGEIIKLVDELKVVVIEPKHKKKARSRWLKTSMRQHIRGDFLFIDCDTIICDDLSDAQKCDIDLCAVFNAHAILKDQFNKENIHYYDRILGHDSSFQSMEYFNTGVIYSGDTSLSHSFFEEWHKLWLQGSSVLLNDQPAFNQSNLNLNYPIKEMNGLWNCQIRTGGAAFLTNAKIIHYFATNDTADNPYMLANPSILKEIKETGVVPDYIKNYLQEPKSCFYPHIQLLSNVKTIEIISSRLFRVFCKFYGLRCVQLTMKLMKKISFMSNRYFDKHKYTKNQI